MTANDASRFWSKAALGGPGCWEWQAGRDKDGYGKIGIDGKHKRAHRVSYELLVGPIPPGLVLDHLCRNPACINPDHLEPVTHAINIRRGEGLAARNARKTHCKWGHPFDLLNTVVIGNDRRCRKCLRDANRRWWRRHDQAGT